MHRNPSLASVKSTASSRSNGNMKGSTAAQRSSSKIKTYDSAPITIQSIEDTQKLILNIKAHQIKKEIDEAKKKFETLNLKYDLCESLHFQLMERQELVGKHSKALNKLSLVRDFEEIITNLNELAFKLNRGLNSAKIRLSHDNFETVKRLLEEFRSLLSSLPDQEALYDQLELLTKPELGDDVTRLRADVNFMERPKTIVQACDQYRMKLKQLRGSLQYLINAKIIADA